MSYILIIGAKSDIAKEVAREYAKNGYNLYLASRQSEDLKDLAKGFKKAAREFGIKIIGGDTISNDKLDISLPLIFVI